MTGLRMVFPGDSQTSSRSILIHKIVERKAAASSVESSSLKQNAVPVVRKQGESGVWALAFRPSLAMSLSK